MRPATPPRAIRAPPTRRLSPRPATARTPTNEQPSGDDSEASLQHSASSHFTDFATKASPIPYAFPARPARAPPRVTSPRARAAVMPSSLAVSRAVPTPPSSQRRSRRRSHPHVTVRGSSTPSQVAEPPVEQTLVARLYELLASAVLEDVASALEQLQILATASRADAPEAFAVTVLAQPPEVPRTAAQAAFGGFVASEGATALVRCVSASTNAPRAFFDCHVFALLVASPALRRGCVDAQLAAALAKRFAAVFTEPVGGEEFSALPSLCAVTAALVSRCAAAQDTFTRAGGLEACTRVLAAVRPRAHGAELAALLHALAHTLTGNAARIGEFIAGGGLTPLERALGVTRLPVSAAQIARAPFLAAHATHFEFAPYVRTADSAALASVAAPDAFADAQAPLTLPLVRLFVAEFAAKLVLDARASGLALDAYARLLTAPLVRRALFNLRPFPALFGALVAALEGEAEAVEDAALE